MITPTAATLPQQADAWTQARAALPANVPVYRPTFVPERFGAPQLLEARGDQQDGPRYTITYAAPDEQIAFILGVGKGALGNAARPDTAEPIAVASRTGELATSQEGSPHFAVSWQNAGNAYQIKAYGQVTKGEMQQIVASVALVK